MMRSTRQVSAHRLIRRFAGVPAALALFLASLVLAVPLAACDKPQEEDCKKAVANIRHIYGTQGIDYGADPRAMVRSCRGSASRESVRCFIAAKTIEDLNKCEGGTFAEMFGDQDQAKKKPDEQPKQPEKTDEQPAQPVQPEKTDEQPAQPAQPEKTDEQPAQPAVQPEGQPAQPAVQPEGQPAGNP